MHDLRGNKLHSFIHSTAESKVCYFLVTFILNFRELKLSGNRLKEFPEEVISLKRLRLLDLSINDIQTIHATELVFEHFQVLH